MPFCPCLCMAGRSSGDDEWWHGACGAVSCSKQRCSGERMVALAGGCRQAIDSWLHSGTAAADPVREAVAVCPAADRWQPQVVLPPPRWTSLGLHVWPSCPWRPPRPAIQPASVVQAVGWSQPPPPCATACCTCGAAPIGPQNASPQSHGWGRAPGGQRRSTCGLWPPHHFCPSSPPPSGLPRPSRRLRAPLAVTFVC